jgi:hypothetical protein
VRASGALAWRECQNSLVIAIAPDDACNPSEGDTINFYVDMAGVSEIAEWTAGGPPATSGYDANSGITLTVLADAPPAGGGGHSGSCRHRQRRDRLG